MQWLFLAIRATFYATAFVAFWAWIAMSLLPLDVRLGGTLPGWTRYPGLAVTCAGALLALRCIVVFVQVGQGTPAPFDPPRKFVTEGPYRYVRNPMYAGGLGVILGSGLTLGSTSVVCLGILFTLFMHLLVVLYEEPSLERRFGASYRAYKRAVPRWLPGRRGPALD